MVVWLIAFLIRMDGLSACMTRCLFFLGQLLEDSLDANSFIAFDVLDFRALIRGQSLLFIFIMSIGDFKTMY